MPRNTDTDKRYSVCIGINDYPLETGLGSLEYAENDARCMDEVLGKLGFAPENRRLLLGKDATLQAMNDALRTMMLDQPQENDLVVFYFAGHSTPVTIEEQPERRSEVFLAPYDFERKAIEERISFRTEEALGMSRVRRTFFEEGRSRKRLFLFDSCYSGDFFGSRYRDETSPVQGHIRRMLDNSGIGRLFISSCLPYQKAVESALKKHGLFTYYVLEALEGREPDALRNNGKLTASSLFDFLADKLPPDQRPVKGGVEQGTFEIAYYPELARSENPPERREPGKEERLGAIWVDQSDYIQDRLQRFVGRRAELTRLREEYIGGKIESGGYVVITGDAGQGKSSIIAKMIADQGEKTSAYHFIQTVDDKNYQFSILRTLMARLILKHNLPEHYIAGESYELLRDYFPRVLKDIAEKGAREIIYIDGVDQLRMDLSARLDLSFLPMRLPAGIVIVVGTRPNKTLDDVKSRTGVRVQYELPGLSREDFGLLLQHHKVPLLLELSDRLHHVLKSNPLYLDLAARELQVHQDLRPEELIRRVENNPNDIFTITFSRMQNLSNWDDVIRPILGTLLVTQEPLTSQQIAHIIGRENNRVRTGVNLLGGLLSHIGTQHTLFHLKLKEYLEQEIHGSGNDITFDAEEMQGLHGKVADWCEQGPIDSLWLTLPDPSPRDDYQEYARKHYVTHLYAARRYDRLFQVLNDGDYEREKLRFDPSTRSSAIDLMLGCQAAARGTTTLEEGKRRLANLWRYTLLRTSLTTQADAYPIEAFQALLALGREDEALGLVELLTQPTRKLDVLLLIAQHLFQQSAREAEGMQIYIRTYEIALSMTDDRIRVKALGDLTSVLLEARFLARAEALARLITINDERIGVLSKLAVKLKLANEEEKAEQLWQEINTAISTLTDSDELSRATGYLSSSFLQVKDWERAGIAARSISNEQERISALSQLALSLTQEGFTTQAQPVWQEALALVETIKETQKRDTAYQVYALAQIEAGPGHEAEGIMQNKISSPTEKVRVLKGLATILMRECAWERIRSITGQITNEYNRSDVDHLLLDNILIHLSIELAKEKQWEQAQEVARTIPRNEALSRALMGVVIEMAHLGMSEMAQTLWNEARAMSRAQMDDVQTEVASTLAAALVQIGQTERAREIIPTLPDKQAQERVMGEVARALAHEGDIAGAEQIANTITHPLQRGTIQKHIAIAQMRAGQSEQAVIVALAIAHKESQLQVLSELVTIACQMQQWELAQEIANQLQYEHLRAEALRNIIIGLVQNGSIKRAEQIAGSIQNRYLKARARYDIATLLAPYQQYTNDAKRIARSIKTNDAIREMALCNIDMAGWLGASGGEDKALKISEIAEREEALCNVATKYAREGSWEKAKEIIGKISNKDRQDEAWAILAIEQAKKKLWEEAMTAFNKVKGGWRLTVVHEWGLLLAQSGDTEARAQIVRHLSEKSKEKASLYMSMVIAQRGRLLEQVRLAQQAWLGASTKDDCQNLFAMIQDLLPPHPEMCAAFYESFAWADTFLGEQ